MRDRGATAVVWSHDDIDPLQYAAAGYDSAQEQTWNRPGIVLLVVVCCSCCSSWCRGQGGADHPAGPGRGGRAARPLPADPDARAGVPGAVRRPGPRPIDLREQVVSFPPQPVITAGQPDGEHRHRRLLPGAPTRRPRSTRSPTTSSASSSSPITTLRNVVGGMNLEETLTCRDEINSSCAACWTRPPASWGIRVARVEIKAIDPPPSIQDAMEKQMRADRDKRAIILTAEGQRESAIKTAEGQKQRQILTAEGAQAGGDPGRRGRAAVPDPARRRASGPRSTCRRRARRRRSRRCSPRSRRARPTPELLAYQYLQTLPQMAQGDANKVWIVPSDFGKALEGFARMLGAPGRTACSGSSPPRWTTPRRRGRRTTTSRCATGSTPPPTPSSPGSSRTPRPRPARPCSRSEYPIRPCPRRSRSRRPPGRRPRSSRAARSRRGPAQRLRPPPPSPTGNRRAPSPRRPAACPATPRSRATGTAGNEHPEPGPASDGPPRPGYPSPPPRA